MRKNLFDYLPPVLQNVLEFRWLMTAEQERMDHFQTRVDAVFDNQFIDTAREEGIERYEAILGLYPKTTDTLQERRIRIKTRMIETLPFTIRRLEALLESLCGSERGRDWECELFHNEYYIRVGVGLRAKNSEEDVMQMLRRILPANLLTDLYIIYNRHKYLRPYTHRQLEPYTHRILREEVFDGNGNGTSASDPTGSG